MTTQPDPILAYADQNFVSTCADDPDRTAKLVSLQDQRIVRLVLSPWHLYEIGKASPECIDRMIRFLEAVEPLWIPPRLDLQTLEFAAAWRLFWGHRQTQDFNPIGLLNDMIASMGSPARSTRDLRAAIAEFESNAVRKHMEDGLGPKRLIAAQNRADFERGRFDRGLRYTTDREFAALHIARLRGLHLDDPRLEQVRARLLIDARTSAEIDFFLEFGGRRDLKAAEVEWQLTVQFYATPAQLDVNRFVDRQHAVVALPYCGVFVTDDGDLKKRCIAIERVLPFTTAQVLTDEDFFRRFG